MFKFSCGLDILGYLYYQTSLHKYKFLIVPHDVSGLIDLVGGKDTFIKKTLLKNVPGQAETT